MLSKTPKNNLLFANQRVAAPRQRRTPHKSNDVRYPGGSQASSGRTWEGIISSPVAHIYGDINLSDPRDELSLSEIVGRAVLCVDPPNHKHQQCRDFIIRSIFLVRELGRRKCRDGVARREELSRLLDALKRTKRAIGDISLISVDWHEFAEELGRRIIWVEKFMSRLKVEKGSRRGNLQKRFAADLAYHLLTKYGQRPPTNTQGGAFYELAECLYEGATYRIDTKFEWDCRQAAQEAKREKLLRNEP